MARMGVERMHSSSVSTPPLPTATLLVGHSGALQVEETDHPEPGSVPSF